jgi:uncharacterized protein YggE
MRLILAMLALGLLLGDPLAAEERRSLTVTGEGQVAAVPDMAMVRVGVTTDAGTAAEALSRNNAAMAAVLARLTEEGVGERDLQTSTLDLGPRFEHRADGTSEVVGYTARNVLSVRVTDLDRLGGILDAVAADGANTFEGLSFGMTDPQPQNDEALGLAVADARRKADLLATAAGITLGEVLVIDTGGGATPRPMDMAMGRMAAESVPVARGELQLSATVRMVFAIGE